MAVAGGLKLDGRLLILASAVFTASLLLLVFGISHGRREQSGDKLVDFAYLGLLFRSVNPYFFAALGIAAAIGFSVLGAAWCVFRASRRTPAALDLPEVQECYLVSGNFDYLIKARVADMNAYRDLLGETLLTLPGVQESTSYVVMEQVKESLMLPVPP